MSVSITSRYRPLGILQAPDASGQVHPAVPIRRHPRRRADVPGYRHRLSGAEDIEYLAWRFYGNSEAWYRIADANPLLFPLDLRAGAGVNVPPRDDIGRIVDRERTF